MTLKIAAENSDLHHRNKLHFKNDVKKKKTVILFVMIEITRDFFPKH